MYTILDVEKNMMPDLQGVCLKTEYRTTYHTLKDQLGEPTYSTGDPDEKVNTEWVFRIQYTTPTHDVDDWSAQWITIYNWKDGRTPTEEYDWHIGSSEYVDHELLEAALKWAQENGVGE